MLSLCSHPGHTSTPVHDAVIKTAVVGTRAALQEDWYFLGCASLSCVLIWESTELRASLAEDRRSQTLSALCRHCGSAGRKQSPVWVTQLMILLCLCSNASQGCCLSQPCVQLLCLILRTRTLPSSPSASCCSTLCDTTTAVRCTSTRLSLILQPLLRAS